MTTPPRAVRVEAPCRADLAGGTLDIWPLGILHMGSVTVNAAIPEMVCLEVDLEGPRGLVIHQDAGEARRLEPGAAVSDLTAAIAFGIRPQGGVRVRVTRRPPMGSGLGGSSVYAIALARGILALEGEEVPRSRLVALVRDLEARILAAPTGVQDHWAALEGGVLALHCEPGGERVERLAVDLSWLGERMTVFDTGLPHHSGQVNWEVVRRRLDGERQTVAGLDAIVAAARKCRAGLLAGDASGVGEAIAAEWTARRRLAPEVCPAALEAIQRAAMDSGVLAFKACGAGGGGSVLLWHSVGARSRIMQRIAPAAPAGRVVATSVAEPGTVVTPAV